MYNETETAKCKAGLIDRRSLLGRAAGAAASLLLGRAACGKADGSAHRPNIIIIIADDLGYGQVGCYPCALEISTPNIDGLARHGVRMTDGYAADGMCWPSRGSLLTGRYHQRWGSRAAVPESERMIGRYLKEAGYVTGCVGKWHNTGSIGEWDGDYKNHPLGRGFDEFFGFLGGMHDYFDPDLGTHFKQGRNRPHYMPIYNGTERVTKTKYLTEEFTDRAVDFIQRHKDRPFFLYLAYNAIHTPHQAPKKYLNRYPNMDRNAAAWRAMLDVMDEGVGRVLDTLRNLTVEENTLILFVGDNGAHIPKANWELRGQKGQFFEGGIRVPFVLCWPRVLPRNDTYRRPVMHIDVLPTVLGAAGVAVREERKLDGKNLLPYLRGVKRGSPHETLFWGRTNATRYAVRHGNYKLVRESDKRRAEPALRLFNLKEDTGEQHDLLDEQKHIAKQLTKLYNDWSKQMKQPVGRHPR